jgi:hypothetical protein
MIDVISRVFILYLLSVYLKAIIAPVGEKVNA